MNRWRVSLQAAALGVLAIGAVHAQSRLAVIEEAIEGAHFVSINVGPGGYGYVVARTCDRCSDPGVSLSINPSSRYFTNAGEVPYAEFGIGDDGITTVFYDPRTRSVTRIKHQTGR